MAAIRDNPQVRVGNRLVLFNRIGAAPSNRTAFSRIEVAAEIRSSRTRIEGNACFVDIRL